MFCTNCGARIPDDADFCTNCGQRVERQDSGGTPAQPVDVASQPQAMTQPQAVPSPAQATPTATNVAPNPAVPQGTPHNRLIPLVVTGCALAAIAVILVIVVGLRKGNPSNTQGSDTGGTIMTNSSDTGSSSKSGIQVDASVSTPIGNLVNGGYVCEDDGNVYYTTPVRSATDWYTNGIVKQPKDGSSAQTIYSTSASDPVVYHLNVTSGRVIFTEVGNGSTVVRSVGTDGSDVQTLASVDDSSLVQVYEGRVYYVVGGTLRVMDPDGSNAHDIMSVSGQLWRVANDHIVHFASGGAASASLAELDGSNDHVFVRSDAVSAGEPITNVIPTSDGTYGVLTGIVSEGGGYTVFEFDQNGNRASTLLGDAEGGAHINRFNPTNDGLVLMLDFTAPIIGSSSSTAPADEEVYFEPKSSGDPITLYHTEDSAVSLLAPTYVDGYVYFACVRSGNNTLLRVPVNGGSVETVA